MSVALSTISQWNEASGLRYPSNGVPFSGRKTLKCATIPFEAKYSIPSRIESLGSSPPTKLVCTLPLPNTSTAASNEPSQCSQPPLRLLLPGHTSPNKFLSQTSRLCEILENPASLYFGSIDTSSGAPIIATP